MRKYKGHCTDFLFAQPSFLSGFGRGLDLSGQFDEYNISRTGEEADLKGLLCDWLVIQQDLMEGWAKVIQDNPEYLDALAAVVREDPYLKKTICQTSSEKEHGFEMATQRA